MDDQMHMLRGGVVVVYHVTIVAIGHGVVEEILAFGTWLRTAGSSIIWNYADPLTSLELLNYYLNTTINLFQSVIIFVYQ